MRRVVARHAKVRFGHVIHITTLEYGRSSIDRLSLQYGVSPDAIVLLHCFTDTHLLYMDRDDLKPGGGSGMAEGGYNGHRAVEYGRMLRLYLSLLLKVKVAADTLRGL